MALRKDTQTAWADYRALRNNLTCEIRKAKREFPNKVAIELQENESNPKVWWKTVNLLLKGRNTQSMPPLLNSEGKIVTDVTGKANIVNEFFAQQTCINDERIPTPRLTKLTNEIIDITNVTEKEVLDQLKIINKNKAKGPDNIPPSILKECANELKYHLTKLFNLTLTKGNIPNAWKSANVTPIHKKDEKDNPKNY